MANFIVFRRLITEVFFLEYFYRDSEIDSMLFNIAPVFIFVPLEFTMLCFHPIFLHKNYITDNMSYGYV